MKIIASAIRRPIFWTNSKERAEKSRFIWSDWQGERNMRFGLSILGIINGVLPKHKRLAVFIGKDKIRLGFVDLTRKN